MKNTKFVIVCILFLLTASGLLYAETMIEIPGLGEVGYEKKDDSTYSFGIPKIGTFDFKGVFNNKNDFDLKAKIPISAVTDYIPVVGQVLGILGLDSVTYRITPSGLGLNVHLEKGGTGMFREYLIKELHVFEWQRVGTEAVLSSLEVVEFDMSTLFNGPSLTGKIGGTISIVGIKISFSTEGTLSFKSIINSVIESVKNKSRDIINAYGRKMVEKSKQAVSAVSNWSKSTAKRLIAEAGVIAHDVKASISHGGHSFDKCFNECTVNYANSQRLYFLRECNKAFLDYYNKLRKDIVMINGATLDETVQLRKSVIDADWNAMAASFEQKWNSMYHDDEVANYFFKNSSENQALDRYKAMIKESWDAHVHYRNRMNWWLMSRSYADYDHPATDFIPNGTEVKTSDHSLIVAQSLNGRFSLVLEYNGNLVYYKDHNEALWSTNTYNPGADVVSFQEDGNLVLYKNGNVLWSSATHNQGGTKLVLRDDGDMVIYTNSWEMLWHTRTTLPPFEASFQTWTRQHGYNKLLLRSPNERFNLYLNGDGNLVLYRDGIIPIWSTNTWNKPVGTLIFQDDGNLVMYGDGHVQWASGSNGWGGVKLILQDDGNLVMYNANNQAVWASHTGGH